MRLLVINPNTSRGVTNRIREAADAMALPGDRFTTLCPAYGPELIVTEQDAALARQAVVDTVRGFKGPCDGIVLASFGNTGADPVRALRPSIPVVGIASAAFATARALGGPFGIVTFGKGLVPGLQAKVDEAGLSDALLGISCVAGEEFGDPGEVQTRFRSELEALCADMHQRGARSIVMGGGPLAGMARSLAPTCPIPIIDGTQAAISLIRAVAAPRGDHEPRRAAAPAET
ncbi:hydantoin racemase [Dinoroseobacter shibae DFL 12 = DSM 16493]|jgi:Asp/Glu/hydantoin racemase|uniref:Hydantoin racemase n=1 Tax=Dinoroseobacter shibae (strain DSM 16493 / NCIMB 14021 / DFL 12) TaxID=398580 RepID=A8LRZ3_DINSH|nr:MULTISPECIES: aspartate/glutamate racemase family protein [Dinoroseobacter]ABV92700.1 hydantoin racemase [Dinoroseobacter shibae DFL 12 = DSM 16493]MDD9715770.1 aspartate/glutamate racemase family protein [Dinoroseobacter sp. PD6]URF47632.1 aspartate/glutamate racemase family protein [Dinoroseobacter shibae]URF51942.1 aspartate/glutamate racemase family protein [Dinoroseobacter shibae]